MNLSEEKLLKVALPEGVTTYKFKQPFRAKVLTTESLIEEGSADTVKHIRIDLTGSGIDYREGQSVGIIPPGTQENGKAHQPRLYSVASARTGDDEFKGSVSICVKADSFTDPETGKVHLGLCSNYLCGVKPGDELLVTGPVGKILNLPEDRSKVLYLISTGTGIAPYRSFLELLKSEKENPFAGINLFFGCKTGKEALYMNSLNDDLKVYENTLEGLKINLSRSREQKNNDGSKKYVQHLMQESLDGIMDEIAKDRAVFYICGLKGMEKGIDAVFEPAFKDAGTDWALAKKILRKSGRFNVETY